MDASARELIRNIVYLIDRANVARRAEGLPLVRWSVNYEIQPDGTELDESGTRWAKVKYPDDMTLDLVQLLAQAPRPRSAPTEKKADA